MNAREEEAQAWQAVTEALENYMRTRMVQRMVNKADDVYTTTGIIKRVAMSVGQAVQEEAIEACARIQEERDEQVELAKATIRKAAGS